MSANFIPTNASAKATIIPFICDTSLAVNDVVKVDSSADNKVLALTDNRDPISPIGIVTSVDGIGSCKVLVVGISPNTILGISRGDRVFLSITGAPISTQPTTGYKMNIGYAIATNRVFFNFDQDKIKSNPF